MTMLLPDRVVALAKRCAVMLGGEVSQSAFHFAINLMLMHMLDPVDYGVFAIVLVMGGLALTYVRSLVGMPVNLLIPPRAGTRRTWPFEIAFGSVAVVVALSMGLIVAGTLHVWLGGYAVPGGCLIATWALRNYVRSMLFAKGHPGFASISDLTFTLTGVVFVLGILTVSPANDLLARIFWAMAAANICGLLAGLLLQRQRLRLSYRRRRMRHFSAMARPILWASFSTTMGNLQAQGQVLLIAAIAGPEAYAPIAAMLVFFAPLRLISSALANMMQRELAYLNSQGAEKAISRSVALWSLGAGGVGLLYGALAFGFVMYQTPPLLQGQPILLIGALCSGISVMPLLYVMPRILLEVRRAFQSLASISAWSAAVGLCLVFALVLAKGPVFALVGSLVSEIVVLVSTWAMVRRLRRDRVVLKEMGLPVAWKAQRLS
ncbi:hypothetical protein [Aurantimonas sp. VKM B-3413]|uniref:hypothetical protein n=1 Tax=Aurantimonas sp. VKM B-3413 TaxID=2779401 RepID=UPI001E4E21D6|nr:hypothetical protein [Aurantimonas sp. VKM B-3413]MCB8840780.1 hypothetical protein [Aurantimonas sp. VKM B-3413]